MNNPYLSLLLTAWKFAGGESRRFILVYTMLVVATLIVAVYPLFYGWFIDALQANGLAALKTAGICAGGYLVVKWLEGAMHGTARLMEQQLAFNVRLYLHKVLYRKILQFPVQWLQANHSGATSNKSR